MDNLSLNSIKVFVLAAQNLSFKKTAAQLYVTPGAVSRQIRTLEQRLGVLLFIRQYREVVLTEAGVYYLQLVEPALAQIDNANQYFIEKSKQPTFKIETSPTFALHWLIPKLASFKQQYPQIPIEISTSSLPIDPHNTFDLYIRRDPAQFSGLNHHPFMVEYCHLVCAKKLLSGISDMQQLLHKAPVIHYKTRPELWKKWFDIKGHSVAHKMTDISFENTIFAIQAAVEGLGLALIPQVFLAELLYSGALVTPFKDSPIATGQYHILHRGSKLDSSQQKFIDWLKAQL